jgi:hypothetical protein
VGLVVLVLPHRRQHHRFVAMRKGGDKDNQDDVRRAALKLQEWFDLTFARPLWAARTPKL